MSGAGRVLLGLLGVVLLFPGACGAAVLGQSFWSQLGKTAFVFDEFEDAAWGISHASLMAACAGLFILAMLAPKPWIVRIVGIAGLVALALTIVLCALFLLMENRRIGLDASGVVGAVLWFGGGYLLGGLPALFVGRWAGRDRMMSGARVSIALLGTAFLAGAALAGVNYADYLTSPYYGQSTDALMSMVGMLGLAALFGGAVLLWWAHKGEVPG